MRALRVCSPYYENVKSKRRHHSLRQDEWLSLTSMHKTHTIVLQRMTKIFTLLPIKRRIFCHLHYFFPYLSLITFPQELNILIFLFGILHIPLLGVTRSGTFLPLLLYLV